MNKVLTEAVKNITKANDKEKYADKVWEILQKSYAKIGGIKGSGFRNKQDMINTIPFWKLYFKDGVLKAVIMYKDKGGRKSVAIGTDGTEEGKKWLKREMEWELKRSYKEVSSYAWKFLRKVLDKNYILKHIIPPEQVKQILKGKEIFDISSVSKDELKKDFMSPEENKPFFKYFYARKIGGKLKPKVMLGTPFQSLPEGFKSFKEFIIIEKEIDAEDF